jgi:hypothetical protein
MRRGDERERQRAPGELCSVVAVDPCVGLRGTGLRGTDEKYPVGRPRGDEKYPIEKRMVFPCSALAIEREFTLTRISGRVSWVATFSQGEQPSGLFL